MDIFKKSALGLSVSLLTIMLFVFGLVLGLYQVFGTPDALKGALKDSGFYQSVVGDILDQSQQGQQSGAGDQIPISNPEVRSIIASAASPELLQTQVEGALDSVYGWVQGKSPTLSFTVALGDAKTNLANGLGQYVEQHLATLPACPAGSVSGDDIDAFNATCLPQGVSAAQVADRAKGEILNGDFLKDTTLTADSLQAEGGKSLDQQLKAIPKAYQAIKWSLLATGVLVALLALAVVFLSVNRRSGLKKISIIFIFVGSVNIVLTLLAGVGLDRAADFAKEPLQKSGVKVGQALGDDLRTWWMGYGIVLLALGVVTLIVLHFTKSKTDVLDNKKPEADTLTGAEPDPATMPPYLTDKPKAAAAEQKPRPKPAKKLIQ